MSIAPALIARMIPATFLVIAAFAKAALPGNGSMWDWLAVPPSARPFLTTTLVCFEAALGMSMLVFPRSKALAWFLVATLALFSLLLAAMLLSQNPPSCNCLGAFQLFKNQRQELAFGIARNLLLVGAVLWSLTAPLTKPAPMEPLNAH